MTISQTTRFELYTWTSGEDEFSRAQMTESNTSIANNAAIYLSGTSVVPPTVDATNDKSFYWDKTSSKLYFRGDAIADTSAHAWQQVFPVLPAGHVHADLQPIDADLTAIAALSTTGMMVRSAANTYSLRQIVLSGSGISISNADGTLGNPTITIATDVAANANTIVLRDASSRFKAADPSAAADVATKNYVDTVSALKANSADVYTKTNVHSAKMYQYGNITAGGVDTSGGALPSTGTRTTPRIYVQSNDPTTAVGYVGITGDIWFAI